MIIDIILDRKDGRPYDAKEFYNYCMESCMSDITHPIAEALDSGTEHDVKTALAQYIIDQEYNLNLITYILSVEWIPEGM